jgi:hypothetical protein
MAARKKKTRSSQAAAARRRGSAALDRIEKELPPNLKQFAQRVRKGLGRLERQLDTAQRDARRGWVRLLRDVSHQLGRLEAEGERRWRKQTERARRDAVALLRRLEKAIEPGTPKGRKAARPRRAAKRARPAAAPAARLPAPAPAQPLSVASVAPPPDPHAGADS